MSLKPTFGAVILAGGKSLRMGRDKAFFEIGGQLLLARQIQCVRAAGAAEVFISGHEGADYSPFGCLVLRDKFPDAGPLAGIERALDAAQSPLLLVLAVDLPDMTADCLSGLVAHCSPNHGAIPSVAGNLEPLAAFYPKTSWPLTMAMLGERNFTVKQFAERCVNASVASFVELPDHHAPRFRNWNSPAEAVSVHL